MICRPKRKPFARRFQQNSSEEDYKTLSHMRQSFVNALSPNNLANPKFNLIAGFAARFAVLVFWPVLESRRD
jgi:hypothetical protein